jgi:hypothetical protein
MEYLAERIGLFNSRKAVFWIEVNGHVQADLF